MTALEKNYSSVVTLIQVTSSSFFSNYTESLKTVLKY